ncbi:unnamed protein product [Spirodela intermedia]|uniref:Uncharacterized protein n=2 Tax=Spirodela intermedia TaxID=51605 RepID=A0A7I8J1Z3_SPIIN|nr:unnamed protein product [Spirodela intermedia]CAA6663992.1 unnamed protein product [Spirodela intermedia]CAA7400507.1 unnamed protein product [Spirodela intermedia]
MEHRNSLYSSRWSSPEDLSWIPFTLAELDENVRAIVTLIQQEDGDQFLKEKTELLKRVDAVYTSYRSLAGFCSRLASPASSDSDQKSGIESKLSISLSHRSSLEAEETEERTKRSGEPAFELVSGALERRISSSVEMSRLVERLLGELARRNDEKRETNRVLQVQVERMTEESRALRREHDRLNCENEALHAKLRELSDSGEKKKKKTRAFPLSRLKSRLFFLFSG